MSPIALLIGYAATWDGEATLSSSSSNPKPTVAVLSCFVTRFVLASFICVIYITHSCRQIFHLGDGEESEVSTP